MKTEYALQGVPTGGQHQNRHLRFESQSAEHFKAVDARQHYVEDDQLVLPVKRSLEAGFSIVLDVDSEAFRFQVFVQHLGHLGVVIYDQDGCAISYVHRIMPSGKDLLLLPRCSQIGGLGRNSHPVKDLSTNDASIARSKLRPSMAGDPQFYVPTLPQSERE
jgi:hypothetical protein